MNCEQAKPLLTDYLLEEVPVEERAGIAQHLESCGACSGEIARLRQTLALVAQGEVSEEIPQRIRLVAEPRELMPRWAAFWQNSARLSFAAAGLLCLAIALLALFRTSVSYQEGKLAVAFGAPRGTMGQPVSSAAIQPAASSGALDRAEVLRLVSAAIVASESRQQQQTAQLLQTVSQQAEQQRVNDLRELAESIRYFQATQTMMWKDQVQSQHLVSALMQQVGMIPENSR
ncbi:MAG: zf-HC2 domain-containing protein [Acidobacteria bacterium]|nr:zf-HC2 domain-containing protein [Acidobacteriota bacterium]